MSLIPLVSAWESFVDETHSTDLQQFAHWLLASPAPSSSVLTDKELADAYTPTVSENALVGHLLGRLYKFLKGYTKPILSETHLGGLDDFHFLASLKMAGEITKKELIQLNLVEISTGLDIIRRLTKQGYVTEKEHPQDKRALLISITPAGAIVLDAAYQKLQHLPDMLTSLTEAERVNFTAWLKRLDDAHSRLSP